MQSQDNRKFSVYINRSRHEATIHTNSCRWTYQSGASSVRLVDLPSLEQADIEASARGARRTQYCDYCQPQMPAQPELPGIPPPDPRKPDADVAYHQRLPMETESNGGR